MPRLHLAASLAMVVAGCAGIEAPVTPAAACPVIDARNWAAFVDATPGPRPEPELIVTGRVRLPAAGYTVELLPGPTERSLPPVQTIELIAIPPDDPAAAVVTETDVRLAMPAPAVRPGDRLPYRGVRVLCGAAELAFIAPVDISW